MLLGLLRHRPPGVEPAVVFFEPGADEARARALGAPTAIVPTGRAREAWKARGAVRALRGAIRSWRADVVFAHVSKAQLYASVAARLEGVPELWWQHEWVEHAPLMQAVAGRLPAAATICSSDATASLQRARWPAVPVTRVYPGIEPPAAPRRAHEGAGTRIGIVGRLQRWKRVELAVRALPAVVAAVPDARLQVVGGTAPGLDEDYPDALRAEAARLGVAGAVDFTGHVAAGADAIRDLDVLVHCAEHEPFGIVLAEALLAGVPVVAPHAGGPAEIVRDGVDGLLVDPTDADAVAAAVVALARDPARRAAMGAAGRERALALFTAERMAREAWEVVERVAAEGRR